MSVHVQTCVTILCNGCGPACWADSTKPAPHWSTAEEARRAVAEGGGPFGDPWRIQPPAPGKTDGSDLCARCARRLDCQADGHRMSGWQSYFGVLDLEWRYCTWCDETPEFRHRDQPVGYRAVADLVRAHHAADPWAVSF